MSRCRYKINCCQDVWLIVSNLKAFFLPLIVRKMLANDMKSAVAWLNVIAVVCQGLPSVVAAPTPALPIVDLGYELHQAIAYNVRDNL